LVRVAGDFLHLLGAGSALALGGWLLSPRGRRGPAPREQAVALALTACWSLAALGIGADSAATAALQSLCYLSWLWTLYRLFAHDERDKSVAPIRPVVLALAFVELMQLVLLAAQGHYAGSPAAVQAIAGFAVMLRLLFCVGALVLVHNLYAGAGQQMRQALGWPAAGLAVLWLYDLNLSTVAYLSGGRPAMLADLRGVATVLMTGMLALGAMRHDGNLRFRPSRSFAFRSFSLL